jgi:hypothetical protein
MDSKAAGQVEKALRRLQKAIGEEIDEISYKLYHLTGQWDRTENTLQSIESKAAKTTELPDMSASQKRS